MKSLNSFRFFDYEQSQNYYAQSMPKGKLTANRFDSNSIIYKMLLCLSTFIKLVSSQIYELTKNTNINKADLLLEDWETSVKIPEVYPRLTTITERQSAVKRRVSKYPVYNLRDYRSVDDDSTYEKFIKTMTGIDIEIERASDRPGLSAFPLDFPIKFDIDLGHRNFLFYIKIVVEGIPANNQFPLPFPVSFFDPDVPDATKQLLETALKDIFPTNCGWIFETTII